MLHNNYKIIFFGSAEFSVPILETLMQNKMVDAVVSAPPKPRGRKQIITPTPISQMATQNQIRAFEPEDLNDKKFLDQIKKIRPDLFLVAAYGKILPQALLEIPAGGAINIHGSLLPKYRGSSPLQVALLNGDKETGVSIIKMDEKMDHGPIIHQFKIPINPDETTASLLEKSFNQTAKILPEIIKSSYSFYPDRGLKSNKQDDKQATYTKLIKKEDGFIPWKTLEKAKKADGIEIERFIRAMTPWPGVWTINPQTQKRLKILKARLENEKLIVDEVQWEGRKPTSGLPVLS